MTPSFTATQIKRIRADAKALSRTNGIGHQAALNIIAGQNGFRNWDQLLHSGGSTALHALAQSLPAAITATTVAPVPLPIIPPAAALPRLTPRAQANGRQRYYLHGDQYEQDGSRFYCAQCDVFFSADHFQSHGPHTGERFLSSLAYFRGRYGSEYYRPENAPNMLEAGARAAREEYKALRPFFSDWLLAQRRTDTSLGYMVRGLMTARGLPTTPKSIVELREHYENRGWSRHMSSGSLEQAWEAFTKR